MHDAVASLLNVLDLNRLDDDTFVGDNPGLAGGHVFGGHVLAQALMASHRVVGGTLAHSMHAYFLHRGTPRQSIRYEVRPLRASRAFETFEVTAHQGDQVILQALTSHHIDEPGPSHQIPMDAVGPPTGDGYEQALLRVMVPAGREAQKFDFELPVEIRGVGALAMFSTEVKPPNERVFLRMRDKVPDDPALHQCLFAYASDYAIMAPALNAHPFPINGIQTASLDHALWFHAPMRIDDWMLFELDSPVGGHGRGLGRGLLFDGDGRLVASCVQEALMRPNAPRK